MDAQALRCQITNLEQRLSDLRQQLQQAEHTEGSNNVEAHDPQPGSTSSPRVNGIGSRPLDLEEYKRYGRQMIVPSIGIEGQIKLKKTKVLIIGIGGLGCPAATYLAGAGVGTLGLVDGDTVELSNLHRQTLHSVNTVGWNKTDSAVRTLERLNPKVQYRKYTHHLRPEDAIDIFDEYDLILDCTDHPTSRYLISDACVLSGKPLVSASALKTDGQLMTLYMPPGAGPCYRCVFPKPPPSGSVTSCGEGGILGPVVGVMGVLQAAKAIEMIAQHASLTPKEGLVWHDMEAKLLIYSAFDPIPFRPPVNLPKPRKNCASCSASSTITNESLRSGSLDYQSFCGWDMPVKLLGDHERVTAKDYKQAMDSPHILVDVREKLHYDICHIPKSINVPYYLLPKKSREADVRAVESTGIGAPLEELQSRAHSTPNAPIFFICRFGNDSQEAVRSVKDRFPSLIQDEVGKERFVGDIKGGLHAWSQVDPSFPRY